MAAELVYSRISARSEHAIPCWYTYLRTKNAHNAALSVYAVALVPGAAA